MKTNLGHKIGYAMRRALDVTAASMLAIATTTCVVWWLAQTNNHLAAAVAITVVDVLAMAGLMRNGARLRKLESDVWQLQWEDRIDETRRVYVEARDAYDVARSILRDMPEISIVVISDSADIHIDQIERIDLRGES